MDVQKQIDLYVGDVIKHLPRNQRRDVGDELTALLREELAGKSPDDATAALRAFGRPSEVAARYHPAIAIVDPSDTRSFLIAALAGVVVVALISAPVIARHGRDAANVLMLAWLGFLVCWFGLKGWIWRRWPKSGQWRPRDHDAANRGGTLALILIILLGMVCYGAPQWLFATLTGGLRLAPMLDYTDDFRDHRLPWLLATWGCAVVLMIVVLVEGRWRPATRAISVAVNIATILILTWFRFGAPMFVTPSIDANVRAALAFIIGVVLIDTAVRLYNMRGTSQRRITA